MLLETAFFAALCVPAAFLILQVPDSARTSLLYAAGFSALAFVATSVLVPHFSWFLEKRGLKGKDMGRRGTPDEHREMCVVVAARAPRVPHTRARASLTPTARPPLPSPSAVGLVCSAVFLAVVIPTQFSVDVEQRGQYNAALLSICFMTLLGFADDVLDLPWRYKLILPPIASLPLLASYSSGGGGTDITLPSWLGAQLVSDKALTAVGAILDSWLNVVTIDLNSEGKVLNLGTLYYVYMGLLAVFATNAINIYAGINGLEAGQSAVIGIAIFTMNVLELSMYELRSEDNATYRAHLFSALIGLPFIGVTLGVLRHNVWPAKVFVGDTFCYFAGMMFAVQGILGHFSKSLLLFFLPQIVNFVYSLPQLLKVYPCPRHRLPFYDAELDALRPSTFELVQLGGSETSSQVEKRAALETPTGSSRRRRGSNSVSATPVAAAAAAPPSRVRNNLTLINLVLSWTGPMHERTTTNVLLVVQAACCGLALLMRSWLGAH